MVGRKRDFTNAILISLGLLCGLAFYLYVIPENTSNTNNVKVDTSSGTQVRVQTDKSPYIDLDKVNDLVNSERAKIGLAALTRVPLLDASAQIKCNDMRERDYWSHNAPDGTQPWQQFTQVGYSYRTAGENLAYGQADAQMVVSNWMGSQSHKENIVKPEFNQVGYAQCEYKQNSKFGIYTVVVQHLARQY